ncbi:ABC-type enterochelin transport system%2C ATPase component [Yersinia enterocolitica]|uniref:TrlF family AAA-like ATPase n=1 Tax=Yersinia enterocolitica TaxID=630 RepID=UPI0005DDD4C4|nr:hypothetical protein [Yersinia enterocolitica]ELY5304925.1 hypothetical protein [Yersinia enterocolitica]CQJ25313.1 ABC-type enterochelin transport system%2C ATPase component [Yersinia enterocolitica]CQQ97906.1 ABC-type enterochelin transport system%2C ATPase component [Yersinia enterocolitica]
MGLYPKGSDWRKWDLHVHTPASALENQYNNDWEAYLTKIESFGEEVAVIGVTDYCTITGYELLRTHKEKGRISNIIEIFPNIEFRITPQTEKDKGVNIHIIINPQDPRHIEHIKSALGRLHFNYQDQKFSCTDAQLTDLGLRFSGPSSPQKNLRDGINQFKPSFETFRDWYKNETWLNNNSIVVASNNSGDGISGLRANGLLAVRQNIYGFVDAIFSGNPSDAEFFLGRGAESTEVIIKNYGKLMPCIHGSDAHKLEKIFRPDVDRFCWIKADPTFNGLKQIIFDPSRVRIQQHSPDKKTPYQYIDNVRFIDQSGKLFFSNKPIYFSRDLNAIIGGKSSGKSLLLYHVAQAINKDEVASKLGLTGQQDYADLTHLDIEVTWGNGDVSKLGCDESKPLTYIPQLYINHLAENSGRSQLNQLVESILHQNEEFKVFAIENKTRREAQVKLIKSHITHLVDLRKKHSECIREIETIGNLKAISEEINRQEKSIEELRKLSAFTIDEENAYLRLNRRAENLTSRKNTVERLDDARRLIRNSLELNAPVIIKSLIAQVRVDSSLPDNSTFLNNSIKLLDKGLFSAIEEYFSEIDTRFVHASQLTMKIKTESETTQLELNPLSVKITDQESLKLANESLEKEREKQRKINQLLEIKKSLLDEENTTRGHIRDAYSSLFNFYQTYINELKKPEYSPPGEINISAIISFDEQKFEKFTSSFDRRGNIQFLLGNLIDLKGNYQFNVQQHVDQICSIDERLIINDEKLPTTRRGIEESDILNSLYDDCFNIDFSVRYRDDDIIQMSPGKRGLVLLNLILHLSHSRHPILIDQPEDNLDNRTIYSQLNDFVRIRKNDRQIIMVTHNANLVVGTDAECVIVSNQRGQRSGIENLEFRFEYYTGALECSFGAAEISEKLEDRGIREHVCEILEGGIQAFRERERKYGLNNL